MAGNTRAGKQRVRLSVRERDGHTCQLCYATGLNAEPGRDEGGKLFETLDHIVPHCAGGKPSAYNFVVLCSACNEAKGTKVLREFLELARDRYIRQKARYRAEGLLMPKSDFPFESPVENWLKILREQGIRMTSMDAVRKRSTSLKKRWGVLSEQEVVR